MSEVARLTPDAPTTTAFLGHSLAGILGVRPRFRELSARQAANAAWLRRALYETRFRQADRHAVHEARSVDFRAIEDPEVTGIVVWIERDLRVRSVPDGRVSVTYAIEGEVAAGQEMPVSRFGSWVVDMGPDVEIIGVRPSVPAPWPLAAYARGHDDQFQCWVEDNRGAAQLLLHPMLLFKFANLSAEGSRLRDAIDDIDDYAGASHPWKHPRDGAVIAAG